MLMLMLVAIPASFTAQKKDIEKGKENTANLPSGGIRATWVP